MNIKTIRYEDLFDFCLAVLEAAGMSSDDAKITAGVLCDTDVFGVFSHGTKNLRIYIEKVMACKLDPKAVPEIVHQGPAFAVMDAHDSFGMIAGHSAMSLAIEKARESGVGFVTIRNSCHFGAAGYYANMAAEQGMLGIAMSNVDPNTAVPGGKGMTMGNAPFAYAIPAVKHDPVSLDIAMSATAALKINQAKAENKPIPDTWLIDPDGVPTTDPNFYLNGGALQPMAGHKGYGLSILVEALTAMISGGAGVQDVPSWCFKIDTFNRVSHAFLVFDVSMISNDEAFGDRVDSFIDYVKQSPKAKNSKGIFMPGEFEWERKRSAGENGITLPEDVVHSLELLANDNSLELKWM